jgi:hypothetical protein
MHQRPRFRRLLSRLFVALLNTLFGLKLHHYNNSILFRTQQLRSVSVRTNSFGFQPEALIKLLRAGRTYVEVPFEDRYLIDGRRTKAFRFRNVVGVCWFVMATLWDVYIARNLPAPLPLRQPCEVSHE